MSSDERNTFKPYDRHDDHPAASAAEAWPPPGPTGRVAIGGDRTMLTFSVSSYVVLTQLEQEFACYRDVSIGTSFDGDSFILVVECDDTAMTVWEVRAAVLTFDPGCTLRRQISLPQGTYDPSAA